MIDAFGMMLVVRRGGCGSTMRGENLKQKSKQGIEKETFGWQLQLSQEGCLRGTKKSSKKDKNVKKVGDCFEEDERQGPLRTPCMGSTVAFFFFLSPEG